MSHMSIIITIRKAAALHGKDNTLGLDKRTEVRSFEKDI